MGGGQGKGAQREVQVPRNPQGSCCTPAHPPKAEWSLVGAGSGGGVPGLSCGGRRSSQVGRVQGRNTPPLLCPSHLLPLSPKESNPGIQGSGRCSWQPSAGRLTPWGHLLENGVPRAPFHIQNPSGSCSVEDTCICLLGGHRVSSAAGSVPPCCPPPICTTGALPVG